MIEEIPPRGQPVPNTSRKVHKTKPHQPPPESELSRSKGSRPPKTRILILTEDAKSSHYYLMEMAHHLRKDSQVEIWPWMGGDLIRAARNAKTRFQPKTGNFDQIYVLLDGDNILKGGRAEADFDSAKKIFKSLAPTKLVEISSTPCFEVWLLLHFQGLPSSFQASGGVNSVSFCEPVCKAVDLHFKKNNFPNGYSKGDQGNYLKVFMEREETAMNHVRQAKNSNLNQPYSNPSTEMDILVQVIRKL